MKKVIAWLLAIALTATVSIGATLAYLTDTDEDVNVMTLGKVKIDQLEYERIDDETTDKDAKVQEFRDNKPLIPAVTDKDFNYTPGASYVDWEQIGKDGYTSTIWDPTKINNEVDKMVFVKNTGDYDAYVRTMFAFEAGKYPTAGDFEKMVHLNRNTTDWTWEWVQQAPFAIPNEEGGTTNYFVAVATYNKVLEPGALTEISLSQIALDSSATNEDVEAFGDTYQILVKTQAIQADGFTDADTALNEGFGAVASDNIPWENDIPPVHGNIRDALHYLNGDTTGTKITTKVSKVVFGLTKDHADTVAGYEPYLVDDEQDVPVNAYYIPNGSMYDLYFLASSDIYLPKLSGRLMQGMTNLTAVDTSNLNTSRAVEMNHVFYQCGKLTDIDVSNFDFSSATIVKSLFNDCKSLTTLDVSDWTFPKAVDMSFLFRNCKKLDGLDVSEWDIPNAKDISRMFYLCENLTSLDVSGFNPSNATDMSFMFHSCYKLQTLDVSNWDTGNCQLFNSMFGNCYAFNPDPNVFAKWDMRSAVRINHMFDGSGVQNLNLSNWNMPNLITTTHMFADCTKLKTIDFTGWNTPNLISLDCMFNDCHSLTYLDVSSFDTATCQEFSQLFEGCKNLERIDGLTNFDTNNARTYESTFSGCSALTELDLSTFNTRNVVNDHFMEWQPEPNYGYGCKYMFSGMNSLTKLILSENISFDGEGKVTTESHKIKLPNPAPINGQETKWYNADNDTYYTAAEIPEPKPGDGTVTYVAAIPPVTP